MREIYAARRRARSSRSRARSSNFSPPMSCGATARRCFPAPRSRTSGRCRIGFIGMTLKETATLVTPAGVAGPDLRRRGGDGQCGGPGAEGGGSGRDRAADPPGRRDRAAATTTRAVRISTATSCRSSTRLDPAIDLVVSGHTHAAYICERPRAGGEAAAADQRGALRNADQRHPADRRSGGRRDRAPGPTT